MGALASHPPSIHAVVVPVFGDKPQDLPVYLQQLTESGFLVVVVGNDPEPTSSHRNLPASVVVNNRNRGGIAGGLNRGIDAAIENGADLVTMLDQDSRIEPGGLMQLGMSLSKWSIQPIVVGPIIWDVQGRREEGRSFGVWNGLKRTRLLISSGSSFRTADWPRLGELHEGLFIDYVDHAWSFRAQSRGFLLLQHPEVRLLQQFGLPHPSPLCRRLGMQLYSPMRHYHSLRNLRWLLRQSYVPLDLKLKEVARMTVKPTLWLLFEPKKMQNLRAVMQGLVAPLPAA